MKPSILFRLAVATFATFTLLPAQSAPVARVRRTADKAATADNMQVRLAEVIAMLDEDDLTPEQRAAARKKLEEIVANLRKKEAAPVEVVGGQATAPETRVEVRSLGGGLAAPVAPVPPRAPKAPRAPKPPKAVVVEVPDAPEAPETLDAPKAPFWTHRGDLKAQAPMVVEVEGGDQPHVFRVGGKDGSKVFAKRVEGVTFDDVTKQLEDLKVEGLQLKLEGLMPKLEGLGEGRVFKLGEGGEMVIFGEGQGEPGTMRWRVVKPKTGAKLEAKENDDDDDDAEEHAGSSRRVALQRLQAGEAAKAHGLMLQSERDALRATLKARVDDAKAQAAKAHDEALKAHAEALKGQLFVAGKASGAARAVEHEDADDAEIREMIESMRAEMREIREMMQELRHKVGDADSAPEPMPSVRARAVRTLQAR